ncbi:MAG: alpha/beta hydrolase [Chloroflexi bacterium]|nr:alpha/beta hydrolase [Chloroflexota bacterium]
MSSRILDVNGGQFQIDVAESGSGDPLLYLHGIAGKQEGDFIAELATSHRVIAPWIPGFGSSTGSEQIADFHDLIYLYLDLLDELELRDLPVVGHSLGGMLAAELAAVQPERFSKVALIGSLGLWDQDNPVLDFFTVPPAEFAEAMYTDQKSEAALAIATAPQSKLPEVDPETDEGKEIIDYYVERAKSMSTAAKYLWPIPNKGLSKRLHRVTQPTLLIWGEGDGICPPVYAEYFAAALSNASSQIVPGAAHMVHVEKPGEVAAIINKFLST